jgi:hypothetical protein
MKRIVTKGIVYGAMLLPLWSPAPAAAADVAKFMIEGTLDVTPGLAQHIEVQDRLIMKLYHPGENGLEMDSKYRIVDQFTLPLDFKIAPSISMSGDSKHKTYVLEIFTDRYNDVLSIAPGELIARTPEAIPIGSKGVVLELNRLRE